MTETQTPKLTKNQLDRLHKAAFDYLDEEYAYFVTNIVRVGKPRWTNSIPTAAVAVRNEKGKLPDFAAGDDLEFEYIFNPEFAGQLSTEMMAFVLAHESMHIMLNHLKLVGNYIDKDRYNELRKKIVKDGGLKDKQDIKDSIRFQQIAAKFNIAADCVINDYLAQAGLPVWEQACRGADFIGEDAAFLTVNDVYERLPNQKSGGEGSEEQQANQLGQGDGRGQGGMDSHDWMFDPDFADKVADAIDELNDQIEAGSGQLPDDLQDKRDEEEGNMTSKQDQLQKSMRAGSEAGNIREFQEQHGIELAWVKLLKEVDPDMFKEPGFSPPPKPAWHKRPRKLTAHAFRDVNLPVRDMEDPRREKKSNRKPAIVLALDHSGSIGPRDADRFMTLALSVPRDRVKIFACTFTTEYNVVDLDQPVGGGWGGTDFDAITKFIEKEVQPELKGDYPKAVIVITDGIAPMSRRPTEEQAKGWLWLMSPHDGSGGYYNAANEVGRKKMLDEFIA